MTPYPDTPATWPVNWPSGVIDTTPGGHGIVTVPPGDVTPVYPIQNPYDPIPTTPIPSTAPYVLPGSIVAQGFTHSAIHWPGVIVYWWEDIIHPVIIPTSFDEAANRLIWPGRNSGRIASPYRPTILFDFGQSSGVPGWTMDTASEYTEIEHYIEWTCAHQETTDPSGQPAHFYDWRGDIYLWYTSAWWYRAYQPSGKKYPPMLTPMLAAWLVMFGVPLAGGAAAAANSPQAGLARRRRRATRKSG